MTDTAASNRQKLLNLSRATGRGFQELVQYFAIEQPVEPDGLEFQSV